MVFRRLEAHRRALQRLAEQTGAAFNGLSVAAQWVGTSPGLRQELCRIDVAAALVRHVARPHVEHLLQFLDNELQLGRADKPQACVLMQAPAASSLSTDSDARDVESGHELRPGGQHRMRRARRRLTVCQP